MKRNLFLFAAVASALLCAGTGALWVRSYWGTDYVSRSHPVAADGVSITSRTYKVAWTDGSVRLAREDLKAYVIGPEDAPRPPPPPARWSCGRLGVGHLGWAAYYAKIPTSFATRRGFYRYEYGWSSAFADGSEVGVAFPAWLPPAAFALLPLAVTAPGLRRRRRARSGACLRCGYDLRATPDRCPECGAAAKGAAGKDDGPRTAAAR